MKYAIRRRGNITNATVRAAVAHCAPDRRARVRTQRLTQLRGAQVSRRFRPALR